MLSNRSIGFRVTAWYFAVFAVVLTAFGIAAWFALQASVNETVDDQLEARARGVQAFLQQQAAPLSAPRIRQVLRESSPLGPGSDLMQLCDDNGNWLYRSAALEEANIPIRRPQSLRAPEFETVDVDLHPLRFFSKAVSIDGRLYTVQIAASIDEAYEALERFRGLVMLVMPVVLIAASFGGYWISSRALAPFDRISTAARRISIENLGERLPVPRTGDQLERLSGTLNQMFSRLETSVKRITQFTADASHEMRAPIALIRTTAEVGLMRERPACEYRDALQDILHESERASEVIDSLMTLARADSGTLTAEPLELDARMVVREAAEIGETLARRRGLGFGAELPETALPVRGDSAALRRVLLVLVDNAVKYTPAGGSVSVTASAEDGFAVVSVSDTGVGIARDDLPFVFDRFWRADKARSREQGGAGLGLAIAKCIVEQHSGAIRAESEPGKGSTFSFRIPLTTSRADAVGNGRIG